jgi:hypothetical protein
MPNKSIIWRSSPLKLKTVLKIYRLGNTVGIEAVDIGHQARSKNEVYATGAA